MSYSRIFGQVVLLTICINEIFSSNLVYELRKKYLEGTYSVKNLLEKEEFDFPENVLAQLTLFEIYFDQKDCQKMEEIYQNICDYFPVNQLVNYKLGNFYFKEKNYKKQLPWLNGF
jgi:predicted Zn-dependent protease